MVNRASVSSVRLPPDVQSYLGDVVYLSALGTHIIILNSYQAVQDLFHRRGAIYSGRPRSVFVGEMYPSLS